jgi:formate-dependent nitrite reductase membrane component NrfD
MTQTWALFITVFLSIFHVLGGGAVGYALRAALRGSDKSIFFVVWGAGMGLTPLVFDCSSSLKGI